MCVGAARKISVGRGRQYELDGTKVAVFRTATGWTAVTDECPHMGTSLSDGHLEDGTVVCPWHHWKYDLRDGVSDQRSWACVTVYEVRERDGRLYLRPSIVPQTSTPAPRDPDDDDWIEWDADKFFKRPAGDETSGAKPTDEDER